MSLEGDFRDFGLADIFQLIGLQKKTGLLTLHNAGEEVWVCFNGGKVTHADSSGTPIVESARTSLLRTRSLSSMDLQRAHWISEDTDETIEQVLLRLRMVTSEELQEALRVKIGDIICRTFRWTEGTFKFESSHLITPTDPTLRISPESLLMDGMSACDLWPVIEREIPSFRVVPDRVTHEDGTLLLVEEEEPQPDEDFDFDLIVGDTDDQTPPAEDLGGATRLTHEETVIYNLVDGTATIQDIIDGTMRSEFDVCRTLYDLLKRQIVTITTPDDPTVSTDHGDGDSRPWSRHGGPDLDYLPPPQFAVPVGLAKGARNLVGLDIGSSMLKLVELHRTESAWQMLRFGCEPLPLGSICDENLLDVEIVVDSLRKLFAKTGVLNKEVAISLSGHAVVIKRINLPPMSDLELAEAIVWEAEQYIPFDMNEVYLDYQRMDTPSMDAEEKEVMLAAAKRDNLHGYAAAAQSAGLTPLLVDLDVFCIHNAYALNYEMPPDEIHALFNLGAALTNCIVVQGRRPLFWRDIHVGGDQYDDAIGKELNLPPEQAEQIKMGHPVPDIDPARAAPIIDEVSEDVISEIQKTFGFFRAVTTDEPIDRIVLSGGTSRVRGLRSRLQERLEVPVHFMNPLRNITMPENVSLDGLEELLPSLAVAVGLAIRFVAGARSTPSTEPS